MRALDRKAVRDLMQMKGQVLAICLVMGCGVATFVMSLSTLQSLIATQRDYYERYRFAQVFVHVKRMPGSLAARITEIPGVARAETRIVEDVTLDVHGMPEPGVGRLISLPAGRSIGLNRLHLRSGRQVVEGHGLEALASEGFALAHKLRPGDRVRALINGKKQELRIVGVALSPEYVYQIREGDILPDDAHFGVFWMSQKELAAAFDLQAAFNDVAIALQPGAVEKDVLERLDRLTEPYGGLGAYGRDEQISNRFITNEIRELRGMGLIAPLIFLGVAAFLLNVILTRLISTQREEIAALKAFGYTHLQVGFHYVYMVGLIVIVATCLGSITGAILGKNLTQLYTRFFRFPVFEYRLKAEVVLLGLSISAGAGVVGTIGAVRRAVRLPPAEAMRPEPPASYRPTFLERLIPQPLLSLSGRMVLRRLGRKPVKAFFSCFGIALSAAVLVLGSFMKDAVEFVMDHEFQDVQREDITVTFTEPASASAIAVLNHLPGVLKSEPFRALPARLRFGHRSRRQAIIGLDPKRTLYRPLDRSGRAVSIPPDGLVVSAKLSELLGAQVGDVIEVEVLEGARPLRSARIEGLVSDFEATAAYIDITALHRMMQEGGSISGAYVLADRGALGSLYKALKETPRVASVTVKQSALASFRQTVAENLLRMRAFNIVFASIIAVGVVYNTARIALSERSWELATLRVIGFTRKEIAAVFLGELAVLTLAALPLGLAMGYGFAALTTLAYDTELFRIPLVVRPPTFALAAAITLVSAFGSGLMVRRRLARLDLLAVLKTKE